MTVIEKENRLLNKADNIFETYLDSIKSTGITNEDIQAISNYISVRFNNETSVRKANW